MIKCLDPTKLLDYIQVGFQILQMEEPTEGKIVFRFKTGLICNVFIHTGTVYFQGKTTLAANKAIMDSIMVAIDQINNSTEI